MKFRTNKKLATMVTVSALTLIVGATFIGCGKTQTVEEPVAPVEVVEVVEVEVPEVEPTTVPTVEVKPTTEVKPAHTCKFESGETCEDPLTCECGRTIPSVGHVFTDDTGRPTQYCRNANCTVENPDRKKPSNSSSTTQVAQTTQPTTQTPTTQTTTETPVAPQPEPQTPVAPQPEPQPEPVAPQPEPQPQVPTDPCANGHNWGAPYVTWSETTGTNVYGYECNCGFRTTDPMAISSNSGTAHESCGGWSSGSIGVVVRHAHNCLNCGKFERID